MSLCSLSEHTLEYLCNDLVVKTNLKFLLQIKLSARKLNFFNLISKFTLRAFIVVL